MRPLLWRRVFCFLVFIFRYFLIQLKGFQFNCKRDAYVLHVLQVLRRGRKKKKTKQRKTGEVFLIISLEWLSNALLAKKKSPEVLGFALFRNALRKPSHACASVRSLESWNCCACTSCTWLSFLIGQVWCRPHLATNFGFFELKRFYGQQVKLK